LSYSRIEGAAMAEKKLCFVVSPIGKSDSEARTHADWVLDGIIRPVMAMPEFSDFAVKRADDDARPGQIDTHVIDDLLNADLVIADLSLLNPNVFYEIGIRHMVQKPIIHMQLASENVPFDVSLYRAVKFSLAKHRDVEAAKSELEKSVRAVLADGYQVENPVTGARGRIKLEEHATPDQQVLLEELGALKSRMDQLSRSSFRRLQSTTSPTTHQFRVSTDGSTSVETLASRLDERFGDSVAVIWRNGTLMVMSPEDITSELFKVPGIVVRTVELVR
jgi:hypothetical protein